MAKFDRIDAGLGILFDIHENHINPRCPDVFIVAKKELEQVCGLRNMRIEKLVTEIADAMAGMGFVRACGFWSVSELEYDRIIFQKIPERVNFMIIESSSISFKEMTVQQALDRSLIPSKLQKLKTHADVIIGITPQKNGSGECKVEVVKPRRADQKKQPVQCKYCESAIDVDDKLGIQYGHHAECLPQDICDSCGNDLENCSCASRFMDSDELQPCTGGCGRTISDCKCGAQ